MNERQRAAVMEYLEECSDSEIMGVVSTIVNYSGDCEYLEWFEMYMFNDLMQDRTPLQIAEEVASAGNDFDPDDSYFRWDSCGSLVSSNSIEYDKYDLEDIIDALDSMPYRYLPSDIQNILDDNEDEEDEEE